MFPRIIPIARVTGLQECRVCVENREAEVVLISRAGTQRTIRALNMNKHDNCVGEQYWIIAREQAGLRAGKLSMKNIEQARPGM